MAADRSFCDFVDFVLRAEEILYDHQDESVPVPRRRLRDRLNPLEVFNDREFLARYRFTKATVASLLESLSLEECASNRGLPVPPMLQLLIALRFYGAGTFQVVTGDLVAVSQPTVCRVVERVSRLIAGTLFRRLVKFPSTATDFDRVMLEFYALKKFPGVTGCIDCTHVRIKGPGGPDGEVYRNRKGYFSINVQVSSFLLVLLP
ncbi:putative nuclease HARBI1 [Ixodes scapularis]